MLDTTRCVLVAFLVVGAGCGGVGTDTPDAASGMDGAPADGGVPDPDAADVCSADAECQDGTFCNGAERCAPDDPAADAFGCAMASEDACLPGETCDEDAGTCSTECDLEPDADGDGRRSVACGGDDCDDADPNRYPGNVEICDASDHDEDCDPRTFGVRDGDMDGYVDSLCCNVADDGSRNCGDDCADARATAHPGATEAWSADPAAATTEACFEPPGFASRNDDCDDTRSSVNPGAPEICDAGLLDENCDGAANPPALCDCSGDITRSCALPGACAAGTERCVGGSWGSCSIAPIAEICNGVDDNCDGSVDESITVTCFDDGDDDGYAASGALSSEVCPVSGRGAVGGCSVGLTNRLPVGATLDCDDAATGVYPGATEVCDAARADEDCDGTANPILLCECSGSETRACPSPGVCAAGTQTCADGAFGACSISPGIETCNGLDDNCDGSADEGLTVTCYDDVDDDGYAASGATVITQCPVAGRGAVGGCPVGLTNREAIGMNVDCDDAATSVHPAASELCDAARIDEDCDGVANPSALCECSGVETRPCTEPGACAAGSQTCTDGAYGPCSISPGLETCNAIDDDCDGTVDETLTVTCYDDDDDDSYAATGAAPTEHCPVGGRGSVGGCPFGLTNRLPGAAADTDCDDAAAHVHPGAAELCDASRDDEDCDGVSNPSALCECSGSEQRACPQPGRCADGTQTCASGAWGACSISPGTEACNAIDDDCNGTVDEGTTVACYLDGDNDGFAPAGATVRDVCPVPGRELIGGCPVGLTNRSPGAGTTDCDDTRSSSFPGAPEQCDITMLDDDCDGMVNEGCTCSIGEVRMPCLRLGVCGQPGTTETCVAGSPSPYWACDRSPGAESCNAADDDCDGDVDEGVQVECWTDDDGDGYAPLGAGSVLACTCPPGTTTRDPDSLGGADCDDSLDTVRPGATEICNDVDDDCDGSADEGLPAVTIYVDTDGDLRRGTAQTRCRRATDVVVSEDCNEIRTDTYVGAPELCDRRDNDCSSAGGVDTSEDFDGDGHAPTASSCSGGPLPKDDCNDTDVATYPGATEVIGDGVDQDCDLSELCYLDDDDDGYRPDATATLASADADCADAREALATDPIGDCNDGDAAVSPGDPEIADNGVDDNCSGTWGCYRDADSDGFRPISGGTTVYDTSTDSDCSDPGEGSSSEPATDCDDGNAAVSPADPEIADNGRDDNCSGFYGCYFDADNDGYSRSDAAIRDDSPDADCLDSGEGRSTEPRTDCDDARSDVNPGRTEVADNGRDDDCDGYWGCYRDADSDGYRPTSGGTTVYDTSTDSDCNDTGEGSGGEPASDCDDSRSAVNPDRTEVADNGLDDNCSGRHGCYYDADNDGHSRQDAAIRDDSLDTDCLDSGEGRSTEPRDDCNDIASSIYAGAPEWCNEVENDCDGVTDDGCPSSIETYAVLSYSSYYGGAGGTSYTDTCFGSMVLVGVELYYGTVVNALRIICRDVEIQEVPGTPNNWYYLAPTGSNWYGSWHGTRTGTNATLTCTNDVSGRQRMIHEINGNVGALVDRLGLRCGGYRWGSTSSPPPFTTVRYTAALVSSVGGSGGTAFAYSCPSSSGNDRVGRSIRVRAGASLDAIALGCSMVGYQPQ